MDGNINMQATNVGEDLQDYNYLLEETLRKGLGEWFQNLSKEQLLKFLADRKDITADTIRKMMANSSMALLFGTSYDTASGDAAADFDQ